MTQSNGDNSTLGKDSESMSPNRDLPNPPVTKSMNDGADFWYDGIGVNPIPAITTNKQKVDENGNQLPIHPFGILKYYWNGETYNLRDDDMPRELFEYLKLNNCYEKGIAAAGGLIHRGVNKGKYLIMIDGDNQSGIDAVFRNGLKSLKTKTLVEQHNDRPDKLHAYYIANRPIETIPATDKPNGIKFEVKSKSNAGLQFVCPSLHKDGEKYEIVSECKVPLFIPDEEVDKFENHLLTLAGQEGDTKKSVKELHENKTIKTKGEGGRLDLVRIIDSWKIKNPELTEPILTAMAKEFSKEHHDPVCSDAYIESSVKSAMGFTEPIIAERQVTKKQQEKIDENWKIIKSSLHTKNDKRKAKLAINEIYVEAEKPEIDFEEEDEGSLFKQVTDVLNKKIKRTVIAEDNKSQVIVMIQQDDHVEALDLESVRFRHILQVLVSKELGLEPIDKDDCDKITSQLIAEAQVAGADIEKSYNRIQSDEQRVVIDLGNQDFECVEITKDKIEIKKLDENSPILQRTQSTASQVKPVFNQTRLNESHTVIPNHDLPNPTGSIKEFANLMNFKDVQLFSVHLVAMFLPHVTTPIMALKGVAGSQKTTTSAAIKRIVDPSGDSLDANVLSISTKRDDIIMTMYNRYLTVFENVSKIDTDTSDILCRAVTGSSNVKRAHYKNTEENIMTFKRKIILNGVTPKFNNGDLQTRLIKYNKKNKKEITFLTDSQFEEKFVELRPRVLGEVFTVILRVLGKIDGYTITAKTRMAEFERWGELISQELGYPENTFGNIYEKKMKESSLEDKDNYPIIGIIEGLMEGKKEHVDSVSNLYNEIRTQAANNGLDLKEKYVSFPKAANQLKDRMTDVGTIFDNLGIGFEFWNNTDDKDFTKNIKMVKLTNENLTPKQTEFKTSDDT